MGWGDRDGEENAAGREVDEEAAGEEAAEEEATEEGEAEAAEALESTPTPLAPSPPRASAIALLDRFISILTYTFLILFVNG